MFFSLFVCRKQPSPTRSLPLGSCTVYLEAVETANWLPVDALSPRDPTISKKSGSGEDVEIIYTMDTSKY